MRPPKTKKTTPVNGVHPPYCKDLANACVCKCVYMRVSGCEWMAVSACKWMASGFNGISVC